MGPLPPGAGAPPGMDPSTMARMAQSARMGGQQLPAMAKGGPVGDGDADDAPKKSKRKFGAKEETAEDIPEVVKKAKGGAIKHRKPKAAKKAAPAIPMTPGEDQDPAPPPPGVLAALGGTAGPPPPGPGPAGPPPPGMKKGGKAKAKAKKPKKIERKAKGGACDKMAAGGAMKVRRGFPNVKAAPGKKAYAQGGKVRGAGAATKGTRFQGIF